MSGKKYNRKDVGEEEIISERGKGCSLRRDSGGDDSDSHNIPRQTTHTSVYD